MYCPEEYVLLSELHELFLYQADDLVGPCTSGRPLLGGFDSDARFLSSEELAGFSAWIMLRFFGRFGDRIRACLPSGNLVRLRRGTFQFRYPRDYRDVDQGLDILAAFPEAYPQRARLGDYAFPFVDLENGTLTDRCSANSGQALIGCPLSIAEDAFPTDQHELAKWLKEQPVLEQDPDGGGPPQPVPVGRPKHKAYAWYQAQGFDRKGRSMKALQREIEEAGLPTPSQSVIRLWETNARVADRE
jgi:hypothetical protein